MEQRLNVVTLGVADVGRAKAFYEQGLGWKASKTGQDSIAFFQVGGLILALYARGALAEDANLAAPDENHPAPRFNGATLAHNVRAQDDVARILAEAVAAGATLLKPAQPVFWGGFHGYFADPDGHVWEVAWNPFWSISADGSILLPE